MKIQETVSVNADGKEYKISKDVWDKYVQMHPIRTNDAFKHYISTNFLIPEIEITSEKIESMIMEEYNFQLHLDETIDKARKLYEESIRDES